MASVTRNFSPAPVAVFPLFEVLTYISRLFAPKSNTREAEPVKVRYFTHASMVACSNFANPAGGSFT